MVCNKCGREHCPKCGILIEPQKSFIGRHKILTAVLVTLFIVIGIPIILIALAIKSLGPSMDSQQKQATVVPGSQNQKIALINISGVIMDTDSSGGLGGFSQEVSSESKFRKVLQEVEADTSVRGVLIKVNSPGGSAAASEQIYQDIQNFKKRTNKKVIFYFSDMAASGGYYIAQAADQIIANPQTITGSIGVIIEYLNFGELAQKYGVHTIVYKSGSHKDIVSEFRDPTQEERGIMQSLVNDAYSIFVTRVAQARNLSQNEVLRLADGRVYSAAQAKENKLIDQVGSFDDAVSVAREISGAKDASVIEYGQQTFFESLLGSISQKINLSLLPNNPLQSQAGTKIMYLYSPQ